jgi:hypothetical protein
VSNPQIVDIDIDAYHKDVSRVSHSGLELVIESPEKYHYERLAGNPKERKLHFEQGQNLEDALMRDGPCGGDMIVIPDNVLAKGGAKMGRPYEEFKREHFDKVLVKKNDLIRYQIEAVMRHKDARDLIEADGEYQETIYWTDDESGVDCRLRMDKIVANGRYIVDLKTDRSECSDRECVKAIEYWGYDRQAEFYRRGAREMYPDADLTWIFIFVSKSLPIRVQTIQLSDNWYPEPKRINDRGLRTYARCNESGLWLPELHGQTIIVEPSPNRGKYSSQWEYEDGERQSESESSRYDQATDGGVGDDA